MTRFSANLGFLWPEFALPQAVRAAARAGFDAVEFHWPYDCDQEALDLALRETGLPVISINTSKGGEGEFGLSGLPDRMENARAAIDRAVAFARSASSANIHVMAGIASESKAAKTYCDNLSYACQQVSGEGITILIEPINRLDVPGYFLHSLEQAAEIICDLGSANLKMMFDCYHVAKNGGDILVELERYLDLVGHIQIASVPDRREPDHGTFDYQDLYAILAELRWHLPVGAEYMPAGSTDAGLSWLRAERCVKHDH